MYEENKRLKEEHELLRNALQTIVSQSKRIDDQNETQQRIVRQLEEVLSSQQSQISDLKAQMARLTVMERSRVTSGSSDLDCEVVELGELEAIPPFPFSK